MTDVDDRGCLSRPPSDDNLLELIVQNVLGAYPRDSILSMSALVAVIARQCPDTIRREDMIRAVVAGIKDLGIAVQFDKAG